MRYGPNRTLTSGCGNRWRRQRRKKSPSRSPRVRSPPSSLIGSPMTPAWRIALRNSRGETAIRPAEIAAFRSAMVRAGVVVGIPRQRVTSAGTSERERCTRIPARRALPPMPVTITSQGACTNGNRPQSHAAPRWLTAAPQYARTDLPPPRVPPPQSQYRCQQAALGRWRGMSHGIDAAVQAMKAPRSHTRPNRIVANPTAAELVDREHPVLLCGNLCDLPVGCGEFYVHSTDKSPRSRSLPLRLGNWADVAGVDRG